MRRFRIADEVIEEAAGNLPAVLAEAYRRKIRPLCLCKEPGLAMYIARVGDQYLVKRMPLSGGEHNASCSSYEPPDELSGLGLLKGSAIQIDPNSGMASLKLDFSLSKLGSRAASTAAEASAESGGGDAKRLSLRSLLHYLWHEAELTAWTSRWAGKRHWWNVRWHLIEAARQMTVKGGPLSEILFVPEPFRSVDKAAIEQRRTMALAPAQPPTSGPRKLMILVGEVKELAPARTGHKLIVKHLPGFVFLLDEDVHRRLQARFESELALWSADDGSHLVTIATFSINPAGLAIVEEMALMVVSENWIPYESVSEKTLVDALAKLHERSLKGLRYGLPANQPLAAALLPERSRPMALYIVPPNADASYEDALQELMNSRPEMESWVWRLAEGEMPPLPGVNSLARPPAY